MLIIVTIMCLLVSTSFSNQIYRNYWQQASQIVQQMTLDQKVGQMTQVDANFLTVNGKTDPSIIQKYNLGSVLIGGDGCPDNDGNIYTDIQPDDYFTATMQNWQKFTAKIMNTKVVINNTYQISILSGTDAVHGNQHIVGIPLFPQNIGLAATGNVQNFINAAYWTAESVQESGFNYIFAPTVAVSHNPQWGRFYETMGFNESLIYNYAQSYVNQAQSFQQNVMTGVLTSTKHFMGDGATYNGYDEGDDRIYNFTSYYKKNIQGYKGAISAQTGTIMCSYSAMNGIPDSINPTLLIDKLKNEEGFDGFIISDYNEVEKVASQGLPTSNIVMSYNDSVCMIINAGVDMMMIPNSVQDYQDALKLCVQNNNVSMSRIDEAVKRILAVKISMNIISNSSDQQNANTQKVQSKIKKSISIGSSPSADALQAAQESLVLLKNNQNLLPVVKNQIQYIIFIGERIVNEKVNYLFHQNVLYQDYDNIGSQNGGWTVRWQGFMGNKFWTGNLKQSSNATSVLDGIRNQFPNAQLLYPNYQNVRDMNQVQKDRQAFIQKLQSLQSKINSQNSLIIGSFAESPYAEMMGDINCIFCYNKTIGGNGCLYNSDMNQYMPQQQGTTLQINFDDYETQIINLYSSVPLISIFLTGRPMLIQSILQQSQAVIAAWLPGTQGGQAIANAIVGDYLFGQNPIANKLPFDWPSTMDSLQNFPVYNPSGDMPKLQQPLFNYGYGLNTNSNQNIVSSMREWIKGINQKLNL